MPQDEDVRWEILLKMSVAVGLHETKEHFVERVGPITEAESAEYDRLAEAFERLGREHPDRYWDTPIDD